MQITEGKTFTVDHSIINVIKIRAQPSKPDGRIAVIISGYDVTMDKNRFRVKIGNINLIPSSDDSAAHCLREMKGDTDVFDTLDQAEQYIASNWH